MGEPLAGALNRRPCLGCRSAGGRYSRTVALPIPSNSAVARCVDDAALVMDIIGNRPIQALPAHAARILHILRFGDHPVDPQIARLTDAAAEKSGALGHHVERAGRFAHPTLIDGREVGARGHAVFTAFANAAGLPAIALQCGWSEPDAAASHGLPAGFQLVARQGNDNALFAPARAYEQAHPWLRFPELAS